MSEDIVGEYDVVDRANYWLEHDDRPTSIESSIDHDLIRDMREEIERLRAAIRRHRDELPQFADLARGDSILWAVLAEGSENNG